MLLIAMQLNYIIDAYLKIQSQKRVMPQNKPQHAGNAAATQSTLKTSMLQVHKCVLLNLCLYRFVDALT